MITENRRIGLRDNLFNAFTSLRQKIFQCFHRITFEKRSNDSVEKFTDLRRERGRGQEIRHFFANHLKMQKRRCRNFDEGRLTWKIVRLHCWTMAESIEVISRPVSWSSELASLVRMTASDISVANVSIMRNVRLRNSVTKSSNFAVDRHTSFST